MSDTHGLERVTFEDMMREGIKLSDLNYALAHRRRDSSVLLASPTALFILNIDESHYEIYTHKGSEPLGLSYCIWKCPRP